MYFVQFSYFYDEDDNLNDLGYFHYKLFFDSNHFKWDFSKLYFQIKNYEILNIGFSLNLLTIHKY